MNKLKILLLFVVFTAFIYPDRVTTIRQNVTITGQLVKIERQNRYVEELFIVDRTFRPTVQNQLSIIAIYKTNPNHLKNSHVRITGRLVFNQVKKRYEIIIV